MLGLEHFWNETTAMIYAWLAVAFTVLYLSHDEAFNAVPDRTMASLKSATSLSWLWCGPLQRWCRSIQYPHVLKSWIMIFSMIHNCLHIAMATNVHDKTCISRRRKRRRRRRRKGEGEGGLFSARVNLADQQKSLPRWISKQWLLKMIKMRTQTATSGK